MYSSTSPLQKRALAEIERRRRIDAGYSDEFSTFQKTYAYNLAGFVHDCISWDGKGPSPYQTEVLEELPVRKRVAVYGPHGLGKTALASWVVLWAVLTADDCKAPTTASAWRQLTKFLWPEVHKWTGRLRWDRIGRHPFTKRELLTRSLKRSPLCESFAVASNKADLIEGAHAWRVVYVYDEAKAIPDDTYDATEGAFSGAGPDTDQEAFALAISTPGIPFGRFYDICSRKAGYEDWWVKHVTLQEGIDAGRISAAWAEQRKRQWGENSTVYKNRVLGEFAAEDEEGIIPLAWVEQANERWYLWQEDGFPGELTGVGLDVGGGAAGGDPTAIAPVYNRSMVREIRLIETVHDPDVATMEIVGRVAGMVHQNVTIPIIADIIGIGAGVVHRLREQNHRVIAFNAGFKTGMTDQSGELGFANWRAAAWYITRELLDPSNGFGICLPPDDELIGDLTTPKVKRITSSSQILVEAKVDIKKRLRRSTNAGDAVVMALVGPLLQEERDETEGTETETVYLDMPMVRV